MLLLHPGPVPLPLLEAALRPRLAALPQPVALRVWDGAGDVPPDLLAGARYALVSRIPAGVLARLSALQLVGSLHNGVDHLLGDVSFPPHVRLTRPVAEAGGDALMNEFILTQVLRHHRDMPAYASAQQRQQWLRLDLLPIARRRVGLLGLGSMGLAAALYLQRVGFDVAGWTRRPREDAGVPVFHGEDGLAALLARSDILVNLLPLTPATQDLLDARRLAQLPRGAALINVGRGQHVVDADLIAALDSGQLAAATLDVFRTEPLPPDDALWGHPAITITPHASRRVPVTDVVAQFTDNIARLQQGLPPQHTVDRDAGY
ncbi:MAG: glyoxylate/hydroxypyruvate reductase A [Burkholderiales bacterium]|nr:glyoxylate/hydroxypyruvate reductase A [Burkholderiales bacterium]